MPDNRSGHVRSSLIPGVRIPDDEQANRRENDTGFLRRLYLCPESGDQMLLAEQVFESIFGVCIVNYGDNATERREHPRVEFGGRATMFPLIDGKPGQTTMVLVRDMSVKGIGMLHSEAMEPLDEFVLDMSRFAGRPLGIRCAAERCEKGGTGGTQWVIGATFEAIIESAELLIPAPASESDTRPARKRQPVLARLKKLLPTPNWSWLPLGRRAGASAQRATAK